YNEGNITVSLTAPVEPSPVDAASLHYSFATSLGGLAPTYGTAGTAASVALNFADNGSYTVYGRIFDKDGGSNDYSQNITVVNVPPTATLNVPATAYENTPFTVSLTNAFDPSSADTSAGFHYALNTNQALLPTSYAAAAGGA